MMTTRITGLETEYGKITKEKNNSMAYPLYIRLKA